MSTTPLPPAIALALQCGAARFYPEAQAERGDAYLVGRQFLERFYGQARADLEAENQRLREALRLAHDHIDMNALRISHCKDAEAISAALKGTP